MVVPVERLSRPEKTKKIIGNDLKLSILDNKRTLIITGNNCRIKIVENSGLVKVIGDCCEITILKGNGNVEYIGNNGKIKLGHDVTEDVTYLGNEGEVFFADCSSKDDKRINNGHGLRENKDVSDPKRSHVNICNANKVQCTTSLSPNIVPIPIPTVRIGTQYFSTKKL